MNLILLIALSFGQVSSTSILFFTAEWCGPCQQLKAELKDLKVKTLEEGGTAEVWLIDIDKHPDYRINYQINEIPTIIITINKKQAYRHVGYIPVSNLKSIQETLLKVRK